MSTYRHDLLVSLRLINSIEREAVQAEYENWVLEENVQCERIGTMLDTLVEKNEKASTDLAKRDNDGRVAKLKAWQEGYCQSCKLEQEVLLATI
jgi:hypothetical protein